MPENFQEEVRKEQEWVSMLMGKRLQERTANKGKEEVRQKIRANVLGERPTP